MRKIILFAFLLLGYLAYSQQPQFNTKTDNYPNKVQDQNINVQKEKAQEIQSVSIGDLLSRFAEIGNTERSISNHFTVNELQQLKSYFANKRVTTTINYTDFLSGANTRVDLSCEFTDATRTNSVPVHFGPAGTTTLIGTYDGDQTRMPPVTISNNLGQTSSGTDIACANGTTIRDNIVYNEYDLDGDFGITGDFTVSDVEFGVGAVIAGTNVPVTINIWSNDGVFPGGTLTLQGTTVYNVTPADDNIIVSVPIVGTIPAGDNLVVELNNPDMDPSTTDQYRYMTNDDGYLSDSWIVAPVCGIAVPTTMTGIGFPDLAFVMNVTGDEGGGGGGGSALAYGNEAVALGYGNFDPADPSVFNPVAPPATADEFAGAIDPMDPATAYVIGDAGDFSSLDIASGVYTSLGNIPAPAGEGWAGLEFDPTDGTLYGISTVCGASATLSSIDIGGVSATTIGATSMTCAIALAIDGAGNAWSYDIVDDNFYSVDLGTGASTLVGAIGFDANFAQGMCWDPNSDTVYLASFNNGAFAAEWRSVDTATGATALVGVINPPDLADVTWVSIPGTGGGGGGGCDPFSIAGPYCDPCSDPGSGSALACGTGPNSIIQGIDVSILTETVTVNSVEYVQDSQGTGPVTVTVNLFCAPAGANPPPFAGSDTPFYTETYPVDGANDGTCMSLILAGLPEIDASCDTMWIEIVVDTGRIVYTPDTSCDGNPATGLDSWIVAPACGAVVPTTFFDLGFPTLDASMAATFECVGGGGGGTLTECDSPALPIPDNDPLGISTTITVADSNTIDNVTVDLDISHTWVGDLIVTLESPGGTVITLIDQMGVPASTFGCSEDDLDITLDDDATDPIEDECSGSPITGSFMPEMALSAFDTENTAGDWILTVSDNAGGDTGQINEWCLNFEFTVSSDNDDCANATPIACGETLSGDTSDNTDTNGGQYPDLLSPDEWFAFTSTVAGELVTVSTCDQAAYDTRLSVYDDCTLTNQIAENDDGAGCSGFTSELQFVADGSSTYYIAVDGFSGASGTFDLTVTCTTGPLNDLCENAIAVDCGESVTGTTIDATIDDAVAPTCDTGVTSPGVWYSFTDSSGLVSDVTITMCSGNGTADYDSKLSVYTGDCGAPPLTCVVGNDDTCGLQSEVTFQSDGSTTYLILVHGFGGATGDFTIDINCVPIPPPNDDIVNAIDLVDCDFTDEDVAMPAATTEGGNPQGCDISGANGVWYKFTPANDGSMTCTIDQPAGTSAVTFYTAPDDNASETDLVLVDYFDNQCVPGTTTTIPTVVGQWYYTFVVNTGGITDITFECDLLGVEDNQIAGFNYYPNPAEEAINLSALDNIDNVELYNILGQKLIDLSVDAMSTQVNVSNLSTGTYIMKVTVGGQIGTYKVLKR